MRDLWQHKDRDTADGKFTDAVPRHGTVFVTIGTAKQ
jgi:hypothetical protein